MEPLIGLELARWVIGHYEAIGNTALCAFGLVKVSNDFTDRFDPNSPLCIVLVAETNPPANAYSPLKVISLKVETAHGYSVLSKCAQITFHPDPLPGACQHVQSLRSQGRRLMKVLCFCEPSAYELFIPVPSDKILAEYSGDPQWLSSFMQLGSRSVPNEKLLFYKSPKSRRPPPPTFDTPEMDKAARVLSLWFRHYLTPLNAAGYKAFNLSHAAYSGHEFLLAVTLRRRRDKRAKVHPAFAFDVVSCDRVPYSDLQDWVKARHRSLS
jgi:hypothetical protein